MRALASTTFALSSIVFSISMASADVGPLDKYECHNHHETGEYHCHGNADLAKLGGFVLAADGRTQVWANDSTAYIFAGIGARAEYNYRWFAANIAYFYMPLLTNAEDMTVDESVNLTGWDIGAKAGYGVGRLGSKFYVTGGWSMSTIDNKNETSDINGFYIGSGIGFNTASLSFDAIATLRSAGSVNDYLAAQVNQTDFNVIDTMLSVGYRF